MKRSIIVAAIIFTSACTKTIPVVVELQLPPPLEVPRLTETMSLECLSDETYEVLVKRDKLKSIRIETLERIIRTTHK